MPLRTEASEEAKYMIGFMPEPPKRPEWKYC